MTGYWVSVVTEDWKFRMVTPRKGNFGGVPLNAEGAASPIDGIHPKTRLDHCPARTTVPLP
jgi:hypothetical protein